MKRIGLCLIYILFVCGVSARERPVVQNGILDLRHYNWEEGGMVNLAGDWEFYWHQFYFPGDIRQNSTTGKKFIRVPSFWNDYVDSWYDNPEGFGYATYHVKVLCPLSHDKLALKLLTVESAYRLFINGMQVLSAGHPDTTASAAVPELAPAIIDVEPDRDTLDIVLQVSNYHNHVGGLWDEVKLGPAAKVQSGLMTNLSIELLVTGCLLISFLYYFILYLSFRKRYVLLFFSIVCLIMSIRTLVMGEMPILYVSDVGWAFARRIEYISLYLSVPSFSLFSYQLFPQDFSRKVLWLVLSVSAIFLLLALFASYYIYTYPVRYYEGILLAVALYALVAYTKAAVHKRPGSMLFLAGFSILLVTIVNDILYVNLVANTVPLFYIGLLFFVVTLSVLLSRQFARNFSELQMANKKLSLANDELAVMNSAIQDKNNELRKINHEIDTFVNRTSHDLRSPLLSVLGIARTVQREQKIENIRGLLAIQEKTLERMNRVISDIIDFSKNKRLRLDLKEIEFQSLVHNALEDHSFMIVNAPDIKKNIRINQFEKFISDPRRISVILNNLVSNAIKYSDKSKEQPEITVDVLVADGMATIEVSDNGLGIEEERLSEIFTLFYRSTSSSSGSGLGLYIIKETVEKLKGYINISSKKMEGTTIKINIPDMGYRL